MTLRDFRLLLACAWLGAACGDDDSAETAGSASTGGDDGSASAATTGGTDATSTTSGGTTSGTESGNGSSSSDTDGGASEGSSSAGGTGTAGSSGGDSTSCVDSSDCPEGTVCIAELTGEPGMPHGPFHCSDTCAGLGSGAAICTDSASCCGAVCSQGSCLAP